LEKRVKRKEVLSLAERIEQNLLEMGGEKVTPEQVGLTIRKVADSYSEKYQLRRPPNYQLAILMRFAQTLADAETFKWTSPFWLRVLSANLANALASDQDIPEEPKEKPGVTNNDWWWDNYMRDLKDFQESPGDPGKDANCRAIMREIEQFEGALQDATSKHTACKDGKNQPGDLPPMEIVMPGNGGWGLGNDSPEGAPGRPSGGGLGACLEEWSMMVAASSDLIDMELSYVAAGCPGSM